MYFKVFIVCGWKWVSNPNFLVGIEEIIVLYTDLYTVYINIQGKDRGSYLILR